VELNHTFEVPVGIDKAWTSLLDMSQVAHCFPGATLSSADGNEYTGSVKVKLGPIQMTYEGSARIVSTDESTHTAVIEASGRAVRSASTANMTVSATAKAVGADRTAVQMKTDLTITGRPAQFGRGVMVEVGDKILGQFAGCLATTLSAEPAAAAGLSGATDAQSAASGNGAAVGAPAAQPAGRHSATAAAGDPAPATVGTAASPPRPVASAATPASPVAAVSTPGPQAEPIDLLGSARSSIVKRVVPLALGVVALIVLRSIRRRGKSKDVTED
jgi:uncharacterized protein